jgi:hypothetical protein
MKTALLLLNIITGLLALASAFFWHRSSTANVKHEKQIGAPDGGYRDGTVVQDGNDFFATNKLQSKWNKWAARFASFAALAQAIVAALGPFVKN